MSLKEARTEYISEAAQDLIKSKDYDRIRAMHADLNVLTDEMNGAQLSLEDAQRLQELKQIKCALKKALRIAASVITSPGGAFHAAPAVEQQSSL